MDRLTIKDLPKDDVIMVFRMSGAKEPDERFIAGILIRNLEARAVRCREMITVLSRDVNDTASLLMAERMVKRFRKITSDITDLTEKYYGTQDIHPD